MALSVNLSTVVDSTCPDNIAKAVSIAVHAVASGFSCTNTAYKVVSFIPDTSFVSYINEQDKKLTFILWLW